MENWDAGEDELIIEDRGLGYKTREILPHTAVTPLRTPESKLLPWAELEHVGPQVSGIAQYTTTLKLDTGLSAAHRYIIDLGSTNGGLGSVSVNGGAPRGFDTSRPKVDVTDYPTAGENEVVVRVSSSLNNRLIARGYYERFPDAVLKMAEREGVHVTRVREHGLIGPVRLVSLPR